jgi:hypothetical protein
VALQHCVKWYHLERWRFSGPRFCPLRPADPSERLHHRTAKVVVMTEHLVRLRRPALHCPRHSVLRCFRALCGPLARVSSHAIVVAEKGCLWSSQAMNRDDVHPGRRLHPGHAAMGILQDLILEENSPLLLFEGEYSASVNKGFSRYKVNSPTIMQSQLSGSGRGVLLSCVTSPLTPLPRAR